VLIEVHAGQAGDGVGMVWRGDDHGVDVIAVLLEHLAVIAEAGCFGPFLVGAFGHVVVDVAKGNDVLAGYGIDAAVAFAPGADGGDVNGVARGGVPHPTEHVAGNDHEARGGGAGGLEEFSAVMDFIC